MIDPRSIAIPGGLELLIYRLEVSEELVNNSITF